MPKKFTTKEFVEKVKKIHRDKYDYSNSKYVGIKFAIEIFCKKHKTLFTQRVEDHINGKVGCRECSKEKYKNKRLCTTEDFINKANKIHKNKFDYSLVEYVGNNKKVVIKCPIHKEFWQTPVNHLKGKSCPKCAGKNQTLEEIIIQANKTHNNKYDYSKVIYKNKSTNVNIICPIHGDFFMTFKNHILHSQNCPKCAKRSLTEQEFIEKANKIHNNKFDYSKVIYKGIINPITIICPIHGKIEQFPYEHLRNKFGCGLCSKMNIIPLENLIIQANIIHNNKYDYSKVNLITKGRKVVFTCPIHGDFQQSFENHIDRKQGCPHCKSSKGESLIREFLIKNNIFFEPQKKFKDCKYKSPLPFDFYLTELNICIEYDGEQHFDKNNYFNKKNEINFVLTQIKDKIKTDYCKMQNIPLIRIKYDENVEEVLKNKLNSIIKI